MGTNTATVVRVEARMEPATCFVPCTAARAAGMPRAFSRTMFSMTTMELSTSMPMPKARPERVIMFRLRLLKYSSTRANSTLRGILTPTMRVGRRSFRNRASTNTASSAPNTMLCTMESMMSVIYFPWSTSLMTLSRGSLSVSSRMARSQARETALVPAVEPL